MRLAGGRASVWRTLADKRRQRGRKHQHFGLHEGQIGQGGNHFSRLFTQVLVFPGFPVQTGSDEKAAAMIKHQEKQKKVPPLGRQKVFYEGIEMKTH